MHAPPARGYRHAVPAVDDIVSRIELGAALRPPPLVGGRRSGGHLLPSWSSRALSRPPMSDDVVQATRPPFDPGSTETKLSKLTVTTSYVEEFWSPALLCFPKIAR